jgi:hypothetical protein
MSPFVFLASLALVATPHLARGQNTTSTTSSAFQPLASKSFDWNNLVRFLFCPVCQSLIYVNSHTKQTQRLEFAATRMAIIAATRRLRTNNRSARPLLSTRSMVGSAAFPFSTLGLATLAKSPRISRQLDLPSLIRLCFFRLLYMGPA